MYSKRYGDLTSIAHRTDCRCHLCHEPVDLSTYGQVSLHGADTASVDHLDPQAFGGTDDPERLRIAHQGCNSHRGTRDYQETRIGLTGGSSEPWSSTAWEVATVAGGGGAAYLAGKAFAKTDDQGQEQFNWGAAVVGGLGGALLVSILRDA